MQFIENCPIFNQIYDILADLQNQDEQIILYKVSMHIEINGNEEAVKKAKCMPRMNTIRLPYTEYYLPIKRTRNSEWQMV